MIEVFSLTTYRSVGPARHDEAMADPAGGANAASPRDRCAHQFVRVRTALHQSFDPARRGELHGLGRRVVTMRQNSVISIPPISMPDCAATARTRWVGPMRIGLDQPQIFRSTTPRSDTSSHRWAMATLVVASFLRRRKPVLGYAHLAQLEAIRPQAKRLISSFIGLSEN